MGIQRVFGAGFPKLVGGPAPGGFGLAEDAFERCGWHGGEGLSRRNIAWIWEAMFHRGDDAQILVIAKMESE